MLKLLIIKCQCKVIIVTCQWGELWRTRLQGRGPQEPFTRKDSYGRVPRVTNRDVW